MVFFESIFLHCMWCLCALTLGQATGWSEARVTLLHIYFGMTLYTLELSTLNLQVRYRKQSSDCNGVLRNHVGPFKHVLGAVVLLQPCQRSKVLYDLRIFCFQNPLWIHQHQPMMGVHCQCSVVGNIAKVMTCVYIFMDFILVRSLHFLLSDPILDTPAPANDRCPPPMLCGRFHCKSVDMCLYVLAFHTCTIFAFSAVRSHSGYTSTSQ